MFGAFKFVREALAHDITPIVGCEFFVAEERLKLKFTKDNPDKRFNQVLLAKNKDGYQNLAKLTSIGYTEGLYGLYPRIDKELIEQYAQNVIALSGGLAGEIPNLILNVGEHQAEDALKWWIHVFGDDFYIELMRHGLEENNRVNEVLLRFAEKYDVSAVLGAHIEATNRAGEYYAVGTVYQPAEAPLPMDSDVLAIINAELQQSSKANQIELPRLKIIPMNLMQRKLSDFGRWLSQ